MTRAAELKKNTIVLSFGKFLPKLVSIITLPIITAILTKAEYGTYDLILTLVTLLLPIATLQIQSAAFRFLIENRNSEDKKKSIITSVILATMPIAIIVVLLLFFFLYKYSLITRVIIITYFFVDIIYVTLSQITRGLSHNKDYSISYIISSVLNLIGIIYVLKIKSYGLDGLLASLIISNVFGIVYLVLKNRIYKYIKSSFYSKETLKEMIKYSWPMIPNNLSGWVLSLSDRLVITHFLGKEANAIYSVANKIPNFLIIAQSVFIMAWQENASLSVKDEDASEYYSNMFNKTLDKMVGISAMLIGFCPIIFKILIKGDYSRSYYEIPILFLAMLFNCMSAFLGGIYIAHKKTTNLGITTFISAVINVIIDLLLINIIGITAGSISTLIAYFSLYTYRIIDIQRFQKIYFDIKKQILYLCIISIMLVICFNNQMHSNLINAIIGIVVFSMLNKEIIYKIIKRRNKNEKN